jgi:hypothetical protein
MWNVAMRPGKRKPRKSLGKALGIREAITGLQAERRFAGLP